MLEEKRKHSSLTGEDNLSNNLGNQRMSERVGIAMEQASPTSALIPDGSSKQDGIDAIEIDQKVGSVLGRKKVVMLSDSLSEIALCMPYLVAATEGSAQYLDASNLTSHKEIFSRITAAKPEVLLIDKYLANGIEVTSSFIAEIQEGVPSCLIITFTADDSVRSTSGNKVIHKPILYSHTEMSIMLTKLSNMLSSNANNAPIDVTRESISRSPEKLDWLRSRVAHDLLKNGVLERIGTASGTFDTHPLKRELLESTFDAIKSGESSAARKVVEAGINNWKSTRDEIVRFFTVGPQMYGMIGTELFKENVLEVLTPEVGLVVQIDKFMNSINEIAQLDRHGREESMRSFWKAADRLVSMFHLMSPRFGGEGPRFGDYFQ